MSIGHCGPTRRGHIGADPRGCRRDPGICGVARRLLYATAMTRSFHHPVRLVPRRRPRPPRPHTLSFTCFRLVEVADPAPDQAPYAAIELCDPTNAMRALAMKPRTLLRRRPATTGPRAYQVTSSHTRSSRRMPSTNSSAG
jgi:hypothetical protein